MDDGLNQKKNGIDPQEAAHTPKRNGATHKTVHKNSLLKPVNKSTLCNNTPKKLSFKSIRRVTSKELEQRKAESLKEEYKCLKILFTILGTEEFRNVEFENIWYLDEAEDDELVIKSEKYKTHKIIRKMDFRTNFQYSPYAFIDFLYTNGSVNEKTATAKNKSAVYHSPELRQQAIPKVGEYCLDDSTGFWKKATLQDIERIKLRQKEPFYMKWEQLEPNAAETSRADHR